MHISFSTYVNQLIRKDLGQRGVFDWNKQEQDPPPAHRMKKGRFREPAPLDREDAGAE